MQPISAPDNPCEQITMDLVIALSKIARGHDAIIIFADRLSKAIKCAPIGEAIGAVEIARLFKDNISRQEGLLEVIIADRDPRWNNLY